MTKNVHTTLHLGLRNLNVGGACAAPSTYKHPLRTSPHFGVSAGDFCVCRDGALPRLLKNAFPQTGKKTR